VLTDAVDGHDVGVVQLGGRPGLAMEAADLILAASGPRGEHLQGDLPAEALLLGLVDDPHAAAADLAEDPIVSQAVRGLFRGVAMPGGDGRLAGVGLQLLDQHQRRFRPDHQPNQHIHDRSKSFLLCRRPRPPAVAGRVVELPGPEGLLLVGGRGVARPLRPDPRGCPRTEFQAIAGPADDQFVARSHLGDRDAVAVDSGAVGAVQVADDEVIPLQDQAAMPARDAA
jgi:hypothetical protein